MRTRSATISSTIPVGNWRQDQYNSITGAFIRTTVASSPAFTYTNSQANTVESITDETVQLKRYGVCTHTRTKVNLYDCQFQVTWIQSPDKYVETWSGGYWQYNVIRGLGPGWLSPAVTVRSSAWEDNSFDAMEAMRPKFSEASFFNDILELNQIRDLINPFKRGRDLAHQRFPVKNKHLDETNFDALDRVRSISNYNLWYRFGIQPTVDAAKEVARLLSKLPDIIRKMREQASKVQTRHYSRRMDTVDLPPDALVYNTGGIKVNRETRWVTAPIYHATLRFKYDISRLTDFELGLRAWAQATGLDKPLRIAWNAIPLSFVVDWFVDIGSWLGSLTDGNVIPIVVQDFCHSAKFEHVTTAQIIYPFGSGVGASSVSLPVGRKSVLSYDRRRGLPQTTSRIRFNLPSLSKVFTLGSLVATRIQRKSLQMPSQRKLPWLKFPNRGIIR